MSFHKILSSFYRSLKSANTIGKTARVDSSARLYGTVAGNHSVIGPGCQVDNSILNGEISVGAHSFFDGAKINGNLVCGEHCRIFQTDIAGPVTIGRYSSLWGPSLTIHTVPDAPLSIGSFCSIGRGTTFQTFNHNHKKVSTYFMGKNFFGERWQDEKIHKGATRVDNDVWIGAHAVILGGVTISNGAVVAANSVVTTDVPPYTIVAGTPARVIGYRFSEAVIARLLDLEWWNWPDEKIKRNKSLFASELDETMLDQIQ